METACLLWSADSSYGQLGLACEKKGEDRSDIFKMKKHSKILAGESSLKALKQSFVL